MESWKTECATHGDSCHNRHNSKSQCSPYSRAPNRKELEWMNSCLCSNFILLGFLWQSEFLLPANLCASSIENSLWPWVAHPPLWHHEEVSFLILHSWELYSEVLCWLDCKITYRFIIRSVVSYWCLVWWVRGSRDMYTACVLSYSSLENKLISYNDPY